MTLIETESQPSPNRLTRANWVETALQVLVEEGIEAAQITRLARRLQVTRGSFYWHFSDRAALLDAIVAEWRARNTGVMVSALENAQSLTDGIFALFLVWVDHRKFDPDLDQAMRDWGRRSPEIGAIIADEDDQRVAAIRSFYRRFGYDDPEAFIRARVIYFTQVSYYALGVTEPIAERLSYLAAYYRAFTGQELDPSLADDFQRRLVASEGTP